LAHDPFLAAMMSSVSQASNTVVCPRCGTAAAAGRKFCKKCGSVLPGLLLQLQFPARLLVHARLRAQRRVRQSASRTAAGLSMKWLIIPHPPMSRFSFATLHVQRR
jgi:hypothetical protein